MVICTLLTVIVEGQVGLFYQLKQNYVLQECDITGSSTGFSNNVAAPAGSKFTVKKSMDDNFYIIKFWDWNLSKNEKDSVRNLKTIAFTNQNQGNIDEALLGNKNFTALEKALHYNFYIGQDRTLKTRYFLLPKADLDLFADKLLDKCTAIGGIATLPFKWRPQDGAFTKDLSITGLAGFKHNCSANVAYSVLLGIGVTSVTADSSNSKSPSSSDLAAITISLGGVFQYKGLQIGIFTGIDKISNNRTTNWKYQGKPWIGIGVGFSIFSDNTPSTKEGKN